MIEERRLRKEIVIPQDVEIDIGDVITVKKKNHVVKKRLSFPTVSIVKKESKIVIEPKKFTKNEKTIINTFKAHLLNMIKGVQEPYVYKVQICSSHFPMAVTMEGKKLVVKNFFGEKVPRKADILENVDVKIEGDMITITSPDMELAGQTAANFEQCTRITNRDRRIFQDGLWITDKAEGS